MIAIRFASLADLELLRHRWVRIMTHGTGHPHEMLGLGGGRQIDRGSWRAMVERHVDGLIGRVEVLVADLVSVPGEPVGWVAWEPGAQYHKHTLHVVSVLGAPNGGAGEGMRRKGVASALLDEALGAHPFHAAFITPAGQQLLEAWAARRPAVSLLGLGREVSA